MISALREFADRWLGRGDATITVPSFDGALKANQILEKAETIGQFEAPEDLATDGKALYIADEIFFCGTAVEVTPIRSIDRVKIGIGSRGPITKRIQDEFFALVEGKKPDRHNWLTPVSVPLGAGTR